MPGWTPQDPKKMVPGRGGNPLWTPSMKLQLLELYILHAEDPLVRDLTPTGRANVKKMVSKILHKYIKMSDGSEKTLNTWTEDHIAAVLVSKGLLDGKGMLHYVDEVMKTVKVRTVKCCRQKCDLIIDLAKRDTK